MAEPPSPSRAACPPGARVFMRWALAAAMASGLAACGGEPLHPSKWKDPPGEILEGEGLLTGEDGAWTIYRSE